MRRGGEEFTGIDTRPSKSEYARRLAALARAARPGHWVKNLACFAGLVFSRRLFDPTAQVAAALAFSGFCFASSSVYLLNDVADLPYDRDNPSKQHRPLASGSLPRSWALAASAVLATLAVALMAPLPKVCAGVVGAYLVMNVAYSVRLKHVVLLDVGIIAFGFVLRVLLGVYAVGVNPTSWIVLCMFFLALFLGFAKRRGEMGVEGSGSHRRPVLAAYRVEFLDLLLVMTATTSVICYALYTVTGYQDNATLVVTVPLVTYGIIRYLLLVTVLGQGESPERLLVTDRVLQATVALWVALCVLILYSNVRLFEE